VNINDHPAAFDQAKAAAAEALRKADTFMLYIPNGDMINVWITGRALVLAETFYEALGMMFLDACQLYHVKPREMLFYLEERSARQ